MKLTQFTDFGLRILMYLTNENREEPVKIIEVAEQFNIPRNHLIKVVNKMAHLGWIKTTRGRYGGMQLAVDPQKLRIGEILRELEESYELIDCDIGPCQLRSNCSVKMILSKAMNNFLNELDQYTLADVVIGQTSETIQEMHLSYTSRLISATS